MTDKEKKYCPFKFSASGVDWDCSEKNCMAWFGDYCIIIYEKELSIKRLEGC